MTTTRTKIDALSLAHHLCVVADHYRSNARTLRELAAVQGCDEGVKARYESLAKAFDTQGHESSTVGEALYSHDALALDGDLLIITERRG